MIFLKKILGSSLKNSKTDRPLNGVLETDAVKVDEVNINAEGGETNTNNEVVPLNLEQSQVNEQTGVENTMNVNQQVVVQFSNINGLQIGSTYNISSGSTPDKMVSNVEKGKKLKSKYPKTITIEEMMKSQDELSNRILTEIATHLGNDYKMFMRELGFSEGQMSAMYLDHSAYGIREVIYQLLLDWERNTDGEKTVGYLTTLLWNCGHRECVHRLKPVWKSLIKNGTTKQ